MQRANLFERVREGIVSDVVEQRRRPDDRLLAVGDRDRLLGFAKERECAPGKVVSAERVLEPRMGSAGIDEIRPTELADIAQALEDFGIDEAQCELVDADVVPDRVAQNLETRAPFVSLGAR
jgi:hypothetical protein